MAFSLYLFKEENALEQSRRNFSWFRIRVHGQDAFGYHIEILYMIECIVKLCRIQNIAARSTLLEAGTFILPERSILVQSLDSRDEDKLPFICSGLSQTVCVVTCSKQGEATCLRHL